MEYPPERTSENQDVDQHRSELEYRMRSRVKIMMRAGKNQFLQRTDKPQVCERVANRQIFQFEASVHVELSQYSATDISPRNKRGSISGSHRIFQPLLKVVRGANLVSDDLAYHRA
jgi:hypothetical protein